MKYVFGIVFVFLLLAVVFFGGLMLVRERAQSYRVPVAFGLPEGETMQFHFGIPAKIIRDDPPGMDFNRVPLWSKWQEERFKLTDGDDNVIPLRRMEYSELLDRGEGGFVSVLKDDAVFVLYAELKQGDQYTCHYRRFGENAEQSRYSFTVPSEPRRDQGLFMPVRNRGSW